MAQGRQDWDIRCEADWVILTVKGRVDSFNSELFSQQLKELVATGSSNVALDLSQARFMSLPLIKELTKMADDLKSQGRKMALMRASEKLKRQIDIYASLDNMRVVRAESELLNS